MGGKPVVTANKELLATHGRELFETAEGAGVDILFEASVGGGIPLDPAAARVARRRPHPPGDGHRQRHDQLHPHPHDRRRRRRSPTRWPRRSGSGSPKPTPPPTSRASTPRPRPRSSRRSRSARGSSPATSTARASPTSPPTTSRRPRDLGYVVKLLAVAEELDGEVAVRVHPAMVPGAPPARRRCATRSTRCSSRATRSASSCSTAAAPAAPPPRRRCSAISSTRRRTCVEGRKGATIGTLARKPIRADRRGRVAVLPADGGGRPPRCAARRSPASSAATACRSGRCSSAASGDEARLIFVTHKAREADLRATVDALARASSRSHRVGSVAAGDGRRRVSAGRVRLAGAHRGVPRAPAGHRRHAGGHPARGQHAVARRAARRAARRCRAGAASRSRGSTRPGRSRTAA